MQTRTLAAVGFCVIACGPLPPIGGSGEGTEGDETSAGPTSGSPTSSEPTSGEPETSGSGSGTDTSPPPECQNDGDCGYGECSYCINGSCEYSPGCCGLMPAPGGELQFRCIGYECYDDDGCPDGERCGEPGSRGGFCEPLPALPPCEPQVLALSALMQPGVPSAIAALDVDGDGALDVVSAVPEAGLVHVALGDGKGAFGAVASFPSKLEPGAHRIAWADFDGDGDPDLAISRPVPTGELALLFGQDAMFADAVLISLGSSPHAVWAGDFDGDGDADLVALNSEGPARLSVRLGDGLGGFTDELPASVPGGDSVVVGGAGSIDSDVQVELVAAQSFGPGINRLSWLDGEFVGGEAPGFHGTVTQSELIVGDIDGNAFKDVVGHRFSQGVGGLVTLWDGTTAVEELRVDGGVQLGPVADVDGDLRGDLVTLADDPLHLRVIYTGARCVQTFVLPQSSAPALLAAGDLDGDGKADLIAGSFDGPDVTVLRSGP